MNIDEITESCSLSESEKRALHDYLRNRFAGLTKMEPTEFEQLDIWRRIAAEAAEEGAAEVINRKVAVKYPVAFRAPEGVRLEIYPSLAGDIPIISAEDTGDFEDLVTNIVYKGKRPDNIEQTGASFIWGRSIRFIILSAKPYSNVTAEELGLDERDWSRKSMLLRRSHECAHYYTKQVYGVSNNILHDELIADLIGLYDAFGFYRSEWFLRFMGIVPGSGGRLAVYTADLTERVKAAVTEVVRQAAYALENWSRSGAFAALTNAERIDALCRAGISGMVQSDFGETSSPA